MTLLPSLPRCVTAFQVYVVPRIDPGALYVLGKHCIPSPPLMEDFQELSLTAKRVIPTFHTW